MDIVCGGLMMCQTLGVMCEMFLKSKGRTLHSKAKYAQFGVVHSVTSVHSAERGIEQ